MAKAVSGDLCSSMVAAVVEEHADVFADPGTPHPREIKHRIDLFDE